MMNTLLPLRSNLFAALVVVAAALAGCDPERAKVDTDASADLGRTLPDGDTTADTGDDPDDGTPDPEDAGPPGRDAFVIDDRGQLIIPDGEPPLEQPLLLNSIVPNRGVIEGGTPIRLIGTGFREGLRVLFDLETECADLVIETSNRASCKAPAGALPGQVDVLAVQPTVDPFADPSDLDRSLLSPGFTYYETVLLTAVDPNRIPTRGGVRVVVRGAGLVDGTRVEIGGVETAAPELQNDGSLLVFAPPGTAGGADVKVSNFNGMATLPNGVFYYEDLVVERLEPAVGPLAGGTATRLVGLGLIRDSAVRFGDQAAMVADADDDPTSLEVTSPAGAQVGPVSVTVTNANGDFTLAAGFVYFDPAARDLDVVGLAPASGPAQGGNTVVVAGSGFSERTQVTLEGGRDVPCEFVDEHQLRCTLPPGVVGAYDVVVTDGADSDTLADGYTYFEAMELVTVRPDEGAIAGRTFVVLTGRGFVEGAVVDFGAQPLEDLVVVDDTRIEGYTPANTAGPVDVRVRTALTRATLPSGYLYFDPLTRFGGVWGDPVRGAVNVTTLNANTGAPVDEAFVLALGEDVRIEGITNAQGQVTLSENGLRGPLDVTAAKEGFEVTTIEDNESENVTIYMTPNTSEMGPPPPGVRAAVLRGVVSGLDELPKPMFESRVNIIVVETTHSTPFNRADLPPPGVGGLLFEDGAFEIIARPGELAIVVTAGEIDRVALKQYEDGEVDYWTMRQSLRPLAMGLRRFISASPGQQIDGLDVNIDHPMDLVVPVDLDNPPFAPEQGPEYYALLPRLNLGAEGYWEIDSQGFGVEPALSVGSMPRLDGWDADITYYLFGLAFSPTDSNQPMSVTIEETRDIEDGVFITPFLGAPNIENPGLDGVLGPTRTVRWTPFEGYEGPIAPPHANLVLIQEPALGPPKPLWRHVTQSDVTEYTLPELPAGAAEAGLGQGLMILQVIPFFVDGAFNYDDFTYDELGQNRWKAWALNTIFFTE
jgi:hypothetical protein